MLAFIKCALNLGKACERGFESVLSSSFLPKNMKLKIQTTFVLPAILCECERLSSALVDGSKLKIFEERMLIKIFGPERADCFTAMVSFTYYVTFTLFYVGYFIPFNF
jgi:hypothetical protein